MSHSVHPFSHRLGVIRDWKSRWIARDKNYRTALKTDLIIRKYLTDALRSYYLSDIQIERNQKSLRVIIRSSRPGMIIGRTGDGITKLRDKILSLLKKKNIDLTGVELKLDIEEIRTPEANASIVAMMVAEGLEKRLPFRRVLKQTLEKVIASKEVKGAKIKLSGRLGGAEMARREDLKKGQIPLQTLRADIDFAREKAHMTYGDIGIKVWIYKGLIFNKDLKKAEAQNNSQNNN